MPPRARQNAKAKEAGAKAAPAVAAKAAAAPAPASQDDGTVATGGGGGTQLNGAVVVFTGELDGMTREDAEHKVKAAGAKVMSGVSGNTTYFVVGSHLDDGRPVEDTSKYKKYMQLLDSGKKCPKLLREEDLVKLLGSAAAPPRRVAAATAARDSRPSEPGQRAVLKGLAAKPELNGQEVEVIRVDPGNPSRRVVRVCASGLELSIALEKLHALENDALQGGPPPAPGPLWQPWVDKHSPKDLGEVLGNASSIKKLAEWLRDWDDVVLRGRSKPPRFRPGGGAPENINARAALVSGPPGIGKTTACRLVAQKHGGYGLLEYNASDARGQKIIQAMAEGVADNRTLSFGASSGSSSSSSSGGGGSLLRRAAVPELTKRVVILMDEVDGMGGGDRGGNAALIKMIKKTKNPIICICNDHGDPKVRSLAFSCYDIRFSRPSKGNIAQRAMDIAAAEGLAVEANALEALAEACGNDIRHTLNQLQAMAKSPLYMQLGIGYEDMRGRIKESSKDGVIMMGPFDACRSLLTSSTAQRLSLREKMDMYFVDYNLMHLMVHENYLNSVSKKPVEDALLGKCALSAQLIATGDLFNRRIQTSGQWSLLPDMGIMSAVYPATVTNGFVSFPEFPKFLGNYSKASRARRLNLELHAHLRLSASVPKGRLASSSYLEALHRKAMRSLLREGEIDGAVAVLDAYGLQREHLAEHLSELMQHLGKEDEFKLVDPKLKAAMTRELNSGHHLARVVLPAKRKAGRGGAAAPEGDDLGELEDRDKDKPAPAAQEAPDAEAEQDSAMVRQVKARKVASGKAKARTPDSPKAAAVVGRAKAKAKAKVAAEASPEPVSARGRAAKAKAEAKAEAKAKAKTKAKAKQRP